MDTSSNLLPWFFISAAVMLAVRRLRKVKRIYVPDFKRGLRFVNGSYANVLDPGSYRIAGTREHIELVDMRPEQVILDRTSYRDAWNNTAVISVSAEILISNPHLATTSLKDQINGSLPIARDAVRSTLSKGIASEGAEFRIKTAADITQAVNEELDRVGMKVQNVEIVEFWLRPVAGETGGVAQ
jgi:hypothetical protein